MTDNTHATGAKPAAAKAAAAVSLTLRDKRLWIVIGLAALIAAGAQAIGPLVIPIGVAAITILPMVWALLAGVAVSGQRRKPLPIDLQQAAGVLMGVAVLILGSRLGFSIGPNISMLISVGPALLLQELGHLFGTILVALPLAVLLKMGPATVGATFSIDREPAFAMVGDRFGTDSPQYRGVLSMYVYGAVFGAVVASLIASLASSLGVFDSRALAMGAGIGSASMMVAAVASINGAHPEMGEQTLALATTSNLITGVLGVYVGVWIALPLADRFYRLLTRNRAVPDRKSAPMVTPAATTRTTVPMWTSVGVVVGLGLIVSIIAAGGFSWDMVACLSVLAAVMLAGQGIARVTRGKLPAIVAIITLAALLTMPFSPIAPWLIEISKSIHLEAAITVILTLAGLSLGKDLPMLRNIGWKIVPVGTVAIASSFILATIVAEFALGLWH